MRWRILRHTQNFLFPLSSPSQSWQQATLPSVRSFLMYVGTLTWFPNFLVFSLHHFVSLCMIKTCIMNYFMNQIFQHCNCHKNKCTHSFETWIRVHNWNPKSLCKYLQPFTLLQLSSFLVISWQNVTFKLIKIVHCGWRQHWALPYIKNVYIICVQ